MKLEARLEALERKVEALKPATPAIVLFGAFESDNQAKVRFEAERGYPFPASGRIIRFTVEDCS